MQSTPAKNDAHLAKMLGVDRAIVSRHKRRGMPTDTLEAAQAWRAANLLPAMRKEVNILRDPAYSRPDSKAAKNAALKPVADLVPVALAAIKAGRFELVEADLKAALRAVPEQWRSLVELPAEVFDQLLAWLLTACEPDIRADRAGARAAAERDQDHRGWARFLYACACGEPAQVAWLDQP